jgi:phage-related protein
MTEQIIRVRLLAEIKAFRNGMKQAETDLSKFGTGAFKAGAMAKRLGNRIQQVGQKFQMWALGVMFFGMLIQRTFLNIAKISLKTFKDIAGATSAQVQGLARLEAAWSFLKFSIGNAIATALMPLVPQIVAIVMRITDWINKNPELTAKIIAWGAAIGTVFFIIGSLVLGITALATMFVKFGMAIWNIVKGARWLYTVFQTVATLLGTTVGSVMLAAIAIIIGFGIAIWGIIVIVKNWGSDWQKVWQGVGLVITGIGIILLAFIGVWALIPIAIGLVVLAIATYWDAIAAFVSSIWNVIKGLMNSILTFFAPIVEGIKALWTALISFFSAVMELILAVVRLAWTVFITWMTENVIDPLKEMFKLFTDFVKKVFTKMINWIKEKIVDPMVAYFTDAFNIIKELATQAINFIGNILSKIASKISSAAAKIRSIAGKVNDKTESIKGSKATGGLINSDGLYRLHQGEVVVPKNDVNNLGMNITVNTTGGVDAQEVAQQIMQELSRYGVGG